MLPLLHPGPLVPVGIGVPSPPLSVRGRVSSHAYFGNGVVVVVMLRIICNRTYYGVTP